MANVPEIDKFTVLQYDEIVMIVEKIYMTTVNFCTPVYIHYVNS